MPDNGDKKEWSRPVSEILIGGVLAGMAFFAGGALWNWISTKSMGEGDEQEEEDDG